MPPNAATKQTAHELQYPPPSPSVVYQGSLPAFRDRILVPLLTTCRLRLERDAGRGKPAMWSDESGPLALVGLTWESFANLPERIRLTVWVTSNTGDDIARHPDDRQAKEDGVILMQERGQNTEIQFVGFFYARNVFLAPFIKMLRTTKSLIVPKARDPHPKVTVAWLIEQLDDPTWKEWLVKHSMPSTPQSQAGLWDMAQNVNALIEAGKDQRAIAEALDLGGQSGDRQVRTYRDAYDAIVDRWYERSPDY